MPGIEGLPQRVLCLAGSADQSLPSQQRRAQIDHHVQAAFVAKKGRSGSPRLTLDLAEKGWLYLAVLIDLFRRMSSKGNCYDNACAESFFHSLTVEAIHGEHFVTRESMRQLVFEYIEVDYNKSRRHSANGYISPIAFEAQRAA